MRTLILKDKDIRKDGVDSLVHNISSFYVKELPYQMSLMDYTVRDKDFTDLNYTNYRDGYFGIDKSRIDKETREINEKEGSSYDNIVYLVHEDKWLPDSAELQEEKGVDGRIGLWGWNLSYAFQGYEIQQVRWDKDKPVNTFGTLNHEHFHSFDSYPYRKIGAKVWNILDVKDFDDEVVHGEGDDYKYIGSESGKENKEVLLKIEEALEKSWAKSRLQRELEVNATPEKIDSILGIFKLLSFRASGFVEEMRNRNYAATHFDVPIKRSCVINN